MEKTIYEPPKSDLKVHKQIDIPEEILKCIRNGWIAAIFTGTITFVLMILSVKTETVSSLFDIWTSIDVILIFALALGIYKKSRFAATSMFVYFLISKILSIIVVGKPGGILMTLIFLYFYYKAMTATFSYHKLLKS